MQAEGKTAAELYKRISAIEQGGDAHRKGREAVRRPCATIREPRVALPHTHSCRFVLICGCNSIVRLIDQRLAHSVQNLPFRREKDESLLGDDFFPDAHGEFAELAFDQLGLHAEFPVKHGRHPGGSGLV